MQPKKEFVDDETLLGYILMALPDEMQSRIDALVVVDASLSERIRDLRSLLEPVQQVLPEAFEPNGDLVGRTLELIANTTDDFSTDEFSTDEFATEGESAAMSSVNEYASRLTRYAWIDSLVVVAAGITILCLLLPSIWHTREEARRFACVENLRELNDSLQSFAGLNPKGQYPSIELEGPLSFAGVYALKLNDAQLLSSPRVVWCPSNGAGMLTGSMPSEAGFLRSDPASKRAWQKSIGGNYAYNLGRFVDGVYQTPRISDGGMTPLVGDALGVMGLESGNLPTHAINSANVLFASGQIRRICRSDFDEKVMDDPYWNRVFCRAAGVDAEDHCLGASPFRPIVNQLTTDKP
jgi:hypothetical protein